MTFVFLFTTTKMVCNGLHCSVIMFYSSKEVKIEFHISNDPPYIKDGILQILPESRNRAFQWIPNNLLGIHYVCATTTHHYSDWTQKESSRSQFKCQVDSAIRWVSARTKWVRSFSRWTEELYEIHWTYFKRKCSKHMTSLCLLYSGKQDPTAVAALRLLFLHLCLPHDS